MGLPVRPCGGSVNTPDQAWALVEKYERLIRRQADRWPGLDKEDHKQELRIAVYRAALTFEPEKSKNFAQWARGYMKACSARQSLTVLDTTYHLASQQPTRQKPGYIPMRGAIKSTSEKIRVGAHLEGPSRTFEDILVSSTATPEEAISELRDSARFRRYILRRVDPGKARAGLAHYLTSGGESMESSAATVGISRQRLSALYNRALREWQARSRP